MASYPPPQLDNLHTKLKEILNEAQSLCSYKDGLRLTGSDNTTRKNV